jgi:hypothetical protein
VIADGDPVSISAQVLKNTLDAIERGPAIDDPLLGVEVFSEGFEVCGIFEVTEIVRKDKIIRLEASFEKVQELASEQRRHHPDGKKKSSTAWFPGAMGREATPRDDTVEVRVVHEVLTPRMENTDHAYRCTEIFWVVCKCCECLRDRTEKKIVQNLAVHGDQGIQFRGKGEDDMEVFNGQKILTTSLDPFLFA